VPTPRFSQSQVQTAATPNVRVSTDAPSAAFGVGQGAAIAEAVQDVTSIGTKIFKEEKEKADDIATTEAYAKTVRLKNELFYDTKRGVITRKGKNALGAENDFGAEFDKRTEEIEKGLSNSDQRLMYQKIKSKARTDFDTDIQKHVTGETMRFQEETAKEAVKAEMENAIYNYHDPAKVQESLKMQELLINSHAQRMGVDPGPLLKEVQTKTHVGIIERYLSNDQDRKAKEYFEANKGFISGAAIENVEKALADGSLRGESQRTSESIWATSKGNLGAALKTARSSLKDDPKLKDETIRRIQQLAQEDKAAKDAYRDNLFESAWKETEQKKDRPNMALWAKLSPEDQSKIDSRVDYLRKGKQPETDWNDFYQLKTWASYKDTRDQFLRTNLLDYRNKMADSEFKELVNLQQELRKGDENAEKTLDGFRNHTTIVNDSLAQAGIDPSPEAGSGDAEKVNRFRSMVDAEVKRHQDAVGKKITNDEMQEIVDRLMIKGKVPGSGFYGFFQKNKRAFELESGENIEISAENIPASEKAKIVDALQRSKKPVTDQSILELYHRKLTRKVSRAD
jgi:hypothetical protein